MSYDGVVTCAMVQELKENLILGKIDKIYQPQPEQLLFQIHTHKGRKRLFISASGSHSAAYIVQDVPENPANPPVFCMVLRKHIGSARITDVVQHEKDRIIEILLETVDELGFNVNRRLIIEIMGKHSNVLLVDMQTEKIIDSIKHVGIDVNRARQILPGKKYEYPPEQNKVPFTEVTEEFICSLVKNQLQPERSLLDGIQGISPSLAQSAAAAGHDDIDGSPVPHRIHDWFMNMTDSVFTGNISPIVYVKDGKPADFHVVPLAAFEEDGSYDVLTFPDLNSAAVYYFVNRESSNTIRQRAGDLLRVVKAQSSKLNLKLQRLEEDLQKAENSDKYRLYGELLTANLHLVKPGSAHVTVISYYDGSEVTIPLDPRFSPSKNAQNFYKKYGKSKTAIKEKKVQLEETEQELRYLDSVIAFIERAGTVEETDLIRTELEDSGYLRRRKHSSAKAGIRGNRKSSPKPHSYVLDSGLNVLVGRNNKENDWLTFNKASSSDIWLHTKDIPGSHVILQTGGTDPSEKDLFDAAAIAAFYSKASSSENVPVDYVKVKHVKKPSGSKPGFVIFTHNRTLYVNPKCP